MKEVYFGDPEFFQAIQRLEEIEKLKGKIDAFFYGAPLIVMPLMVIVVLTHTFVPSPVLWALVVVQAAVVVGQLASFVKMHLLWKEELDLVPLIANAMMPTAATIQVTQDEDGVYR